MRFGKGAVAQRSDPSISSLSITRHSKRQGRGWPCEPTHMRLPPPPSLSPDAHLSAWGGVQAKAAIPGPVSEGAAWNASADG